MKQVKGNKGEWSELYTFLKLLVERKINAANKDLEKIESIFFPILKIAREEAGEQNDYEPEENEQVRIIPSNGETVLVDSSDLKTKITQIFHAMKESSETTFEIPVADELMTRFQVRTLNAGNRQKEDIILKIHDRMTGTEPEIGFSIKSKIGATATLLNASSATNFIYKVTDLPGEKVGEINKIDTQSKIRDRLEAIKQEGGKLAFHSVANEIFEQNMRKIDTVMPQIMAEITLGYYSDKGSTFPELIAHMHDADINILNFKLSTQDYEYKIKGLLYNAALGMVPATLWDGTLRAHGGVIIVREDGEVVCYTLYNAEEFRNYLFNNNKLESPGSTRHGYGTIYEKNGEQFIKLNLQIRFLK